MRVLNTFGRHLRARFGFPVRKIPLAIPGFTCPNIDGAIARGGCSYCLNDSFTAYVAAGKSSDPVEALIEQYKNGAAGFNKRGVKHFIAYFQSYTNTYCGISLLRRLHNAALNLKNCVGISIGTRADCIDGEKAEYLEALNKKTYLWVEIGVQSTHDKTLDAINRQENFSEIAATIADLKARSINVCAHLIFGLEGETKEMILSSVDRVAELKVDAVKIHPLYVVKNTALAKTEINTMGLDEYVELLSLAAERLPEEMIYQRVSAGTEKESLIAPMWCKNKNFLMSAVRKGLLERSIVY
ncbi:MAG: TIGR01212 family radical SAM protein [Helicobacteraceae bacterium]|jgi:radical SAM protein (TIGR01212 family)|nr:TIGR01212 family radical SAM protein [Helicobacteraceae bacterium]